jgi:hypothetical protein
MFNNPEVELCDPGTLHGATLNSIEVDPHDARYTSWCDP